MTDDTSSPGPSSSDPSELRHEESDEAVQAVVDRVLSYQAGATPDVVRAELLRGLEQVGVTRSQEWVERNAQAISDADPAQG